ncbi:hypothetical protein KC19_VG320000 [Ceratodon purpureus]|nr:hypothetical protein KC19_VG320000 [Ceratodon purpureus]
MASSFSECGSCSIGSDSDDYLSPSPEYTSRALVGASRPCFKLLRLSVMASAIPTSSGAQARVTPLVASQTGLGGHGLRTWPQHGSQHDTPSPRCAPERTHQPLGDIGCYTQHGNSQNPESSPFHRRIPYIAPRPAHTAPPTVSNHVEISADPGRCMPQTWRRPRSPTTKEREALAKRSARNLQKEVYSMQRLAHAEGRQISDQGRRQTPTRTIRSTSISDGLHTPCNDPVKYANRYDTPMCSDWILDAETEYGVTETYGSHAHSPEVVNSTSLRQGTTSQNHSTLQEKISDSWKEGMESRMDFLQTNLMELLQLFKQGTGNAATRPVGVVADVTTQHRTPDTSDLTAPTPCLAPESVPICVGVTKDPMPETVSALPNHMDPVTTDAPVHLSPVVHDTAILRADPRTQDEQTNSDCAPTQTSPKSSRGTNTFPKGAPSVTDTLQTFANTTSTLGDGGSMYRETPFAGAITSNPGTQTRGARGRKSGIFSKIPRAFQLAKDSSTIVPAKKSVWIVLSDHGEIVVAVGKTGLGPKSKVMKDGPPCPDGAQWVHVLRIFKHSVKVLYPSPSDERHSLDCALPPKRGRHGLLMWDSKFLIPYKAEESTWSST